MANVICISLRESLDILEGISEEYKTIHEEDFNWDLARAGCTGWKSVVLEDSHGRNFIIRFQHKGNSIEFPITMIQVVKKVETKTTWEQV